MKLKSLKIIIKDVFKPFVKKINNSMIIAGKSI